MAHTMQFGVTLPFVAPRVAAELAYEAEQAGWDGVLYWDAIAMAQDASFDPWVVLAAMAMRTQRVRLGPMLTPVARRRPWKLAREVLTLDHLSEGRAILPVGLGALDDGGFGKVGEPTDRKICAQKLDEGLAIIDGLWRGEPFSFQGQHFQVAEMTFVPKPVQQPRVPIWVVGAWPSERSLNRALRWDGILAARVAAAGEDAPLTPEIVRSIAAYATAHRQSTTPFDIIWEGTTSGDDAARAAEEIAPWQAAGLTWWLENVWQQPDGVEGIRRRIQQGPPSLTEAAKVR
jgi:alkanesulfonate monooxygenase SsuD/methylene tetrahydromethanopterin reductase-like flavin-dependent oxidoreductase (luciferase family)